MKCEWEHTFGDWLPSQSYQKGQPVNEIPFEVESKYLTPVQAAAYLGLSKSTLAVWRTRKDHPLKYKLCSTRIRYTVQDLDAFVEGGNVQRKVSPNVGRPRKKAA